MLSSVLGFSRETEQIGSICVYVMHIPVLIYEINTDPLHIYLILAAL